MGSKPKNAFCCRISAMAVCFMALQVYSNKSKLNYALGLEQIS